jgi:iron complex outermembrane receptor protein
MGFGEDTMAKVTLFLSVGAIAHAMFPLGGAAAQTAEPVDDDVIIVTAQKRSENVQDVPISIAAFNEERLDQANVLTIQDLPRLATNFSATRGVQTAGIRLSIRGIGTQGNTATEPSVAAFVDGVYVPRAGSIIGNFLDIEGVEVLRGPQGTLFGRNASVGAVSLRTAQPRDELSGEVNAEIGNGGRYLARGHVNVPVADNVSLRVAGLGSTFGGFWYNRLDGEDYGKVDDFAGRATLKAEFGNLTWLVRGDYAKSKGDGFQPTDFREDSVSPAQLTNFLNLQQSIAGSVMDTVLFDKEVNNVVTADFTDENWGFSSDSTLDIGSFSLRLINSYRRWENSQLDGDTIFTPIPLSSRRGGYSSKSHNHELQLISPKDELLGGRLNFVAGLYYFKEDFEIDERLQLGGQYCNVLVPDRPPGTRAACNNSLAAGGGVDATDQNFEQTVKSFAVYSQADFKIIDSVVLTFGGRWTTEEKDGSYVQLVPNPFARALRAPENVDLALDDDRFTWRVVLNYRPNDDVLLFASYSTGFKSGGFNSGAGAVALNDRRIFDRETVGSYEIGAKTSWFDNVLQANLTLYRMNIDGFQDRSFDGLSFVVRNAGSLRHQGFEFDTRVAATRNFVVNASLAYLDSEFTSYPGGAGLPGIGGVQDLEGTRNNYSPKFTGNVGATWTGDLGSSGKRWLLNGNVAFITDSNVGQVTDNNPQTIQDGYALLNARAELFGVDDRWSFALFGNNLTDQGYCNTQIYQVLDSSFGLRNGVFPGSTAVRCSRAQPRTYGVSGTFRF